LPSIEYFKCNKPVFEYDEEITFSWKTINADKVVLKPFGAVSNIGIKTYKIKNFKNPSLTFELIAENTNIGKQIISSLTLKNNTYQKLNKHFEEKIKKDSEHKQNERNNPERGTKNQDARFEFNLKLGLIIFVIVMILSFILII